MSQILGIPNRKGPGYNVVWYATDDEEKNKVFVIVLDSWLRKTTLRLPLLDEVTKEVMLDDDGVDVTIDVEQYYYRFPEGDISNTELKKMYTAKSKPAADWGEFPCSFVVWRDKLQFAEISQKRARKAVEDDKCFLEAARYSEEELLPPKNSRHSRAIKTLGATDPLHSGDSKKRQPNESIVPLRKKRNPSESSSDEATIPTKSRKKIRQDALEKAQEFRSDDESNVVAPMSSNDTALVALRRRLDSSFSPIPSLTTTVTPAHTSTKTTTVSVTPSSSYTSGSKQDEKLLKLFPGIVLDQQVDNRTFLTAHLAVLRNIVDKGSGRSFRCKCGNCKCSQDTPTPYIAPTISDESNITLHWTIKTLKQFQDQEDVLDALKKAEDESVTDVLNPPTPYSLLVNLVGGKEKYTAGSIELMVPKLLREMLDPAVQAFFVFSEKQTAKNSLQLKFETTAAYSFIKAVIKQRFDPPDFLKVREKAQQWWQHKSDRTSK